MIEAEWKSPRKIEEEIRQYSIDRFERQMQAVDRGDMPLAVGIQALREEIEFNAERIDG